MAAKFNLELSLIETGIVLDSLKLAKRDYYSALLEHSTSPYEVYQLEIVVRTIQKLENFRKKHVIPATSVRS